WIRRFFSDPTEHRTMASRECNEALAAWKFELRGTGGEKDWIVQASERDMECVVRALQRELNSAAPDRSNCDNVFINMNMKRGNGNDIALQLTQKPHSMPAGGIKRRPTRNSPVTFVTAEPNNFRALVQHVTGGVDDTAMRGAEVLKPRPKRPCTSSRVLNDSVPFLSHSRKPSFSVFPAALPSVFNGSSPALHNPLPESSPSSYLFPEHFVSINPLMEFWNSILSQPPDGSTFQNSQKYVINR
ncbi:hypothetical protein KI387_019346, partial [Taxus chinensis]